MHGSALPGPETRGWPRDGPGTRCHARCGRADHAADCRRRWSLDHRHGSIGRGAARRWPRCSGRSPGRSRRPLRPEPLGARSGRAPDHGAGAARWRRWHLRPIPAVPVRPAPLVRRPVVAPIRPAAVPPVPPVRRALAMATKPGAAPRALPHPMMAPAPARMSMIEAAEPSARPIRAVNGRSSRPRRPAPRARITRGGGDASSLTQVGSDLSPAEEATLIEHGWQ